MLLDVLEALEGPLELTKGRPDGDVVRDIYNRAEAAAKESLNVPLSAILDRQIEAAGALVFQI